MPHPETNRELLCLSYTKQRKTFTAKELFNENREWRIEPKNEKKAIKKDPATSIRKNANELKVYEKTVKTAIKQDLSSDLIMLYGMF